MTGYLVSLALRGAGMEPAPALAEPDLPPVPIPRGGPEADEASTAPRPYVIVSPEGRQDPVAPAPPEGGMGPATPESAQRPSAPEGAGSPTQGPDRDSSAPAATLTPRTPEPFGAVGGGKAHGPAGEGHPVGDAATRAAGGHLHHGAPAASAPARAADEPGGAPAGLRPDAIPETTAGPPTSRIRSAPSSSGRGLDGGTPEPVPVLLPRGDHRATAPDGPLDVPRPAASDRTGDDPAQDSITVHIGSVEVVAQPEMEDPFEDDGWPAAPPAPDFGSLEATRRHLGHRWL